MPSRRDALRTLAAGAVASRLPAQHSHSEPLLQISPAQVPKTIAPEDFRDLARVVDLIIPRTDTPGASDAGVPIYIDRVAGRRSEVAVALEAGLNKLRETGFFQSSHEQQASKLKAMEQSDDVFFTLIKDLTIDGYYTSRDGLTKELGYHGNTYLREFTGCTHPEHQQESGHAD